jgi:hypothetical protein
MTFRHGSQPVNVEVIYESPPIIEVDSEVLKMPI